MGIKNTSILTTSRDQSHIMHILNRNYPGSALAPKSFALTVCLEVALRRNFRNDNRKSLYFIHGIKADKKRNLKLKISNYIS